jgi:hypothetical protein
MAATIVARSAGVRVVRLDGIREAALTRPDGKEIAARLVAGLTDAVAGVLGEQARGGTSVELIATPAGRSGLGGAISA